MKYKLKEHVTDEMLVACGFRIESNTFYNHYALKTNGIEYCDVIIFLEQEHVEYREINFDNTQLEDDITLYIQDLIELGYVEVVNV